MLEFKTIEALEPNTEILDIIKDYTYKVKKGEMYGKEPKIEAIHAGLECGILAGKIDGLDGISIGPDMYDIHTPKERLSISSVKRVYEYVLEVLKELR